MALVNPNEIHKNPFIESDIEIARDVAMVPFWGGAGPQTKDKLKKYNNINKCNNTDLLNNEARH